MWLFYSLLAGVFFTGQSLMSRHVMRNHQDAWAFSLYFSLVGTVISLPFALTHMTIPHSIGPWLIALVVGLLIVGNNLLYFQASKYIEMSLIGAISKFRLVWVFIFSLLVLGDHFSWQKLLGTLLAVGAGLVIIHKFRRPKSLLGVGLIFAETLTSASIVIGLKYLMPHFTAASVTFIVAFLIPSILNLSIMPHSLRRARNTYKVQGKAIIAACALGGFANLAFNQGLALGDAPSVLVINEAFLVVTLVGEHIMLKEREHTWAKIAAVALAIGGAILIQLAH